LVLARVKGVPPEICLAPEEKRDKPFITCLKRIGTPDDYQDCPESSNNGSYENNSSFAGTGQE